MEILPSLPFVVATVLFAFLVSVSPHCASSLSLDDSFLSSSSSSSLQRQRLQELNEKNLAGIWKLTTNALPYELVDVRSKLDKQFSKQQQRQEKNNDDDSIDNVEDTILLKLNLDGTFKQYDEGYREGRWVTGRWKLQLLESSASATASATNEPMTDFNDDDDDDDDTSRNDNNKKTISWLLLLAMNRQYFGPPYDVLLEATIHTTTTARKDRSKSGTGIATDRGTNNQSIKQELIKEQPNKSHVGKTPNELSSPSSSSPSLPSLRHWQGMIRTGKFLRPSPGKHPLDNKRSSITSSGDELLVDASKSLGIFSLEQILSSATTKSENPSDSSVLVVDGNDDTFFFPCSPFGDGGFLQ